MKRYQCLTLLICSLFFFAKSDAQWTQLNDAPFVAHHSNGFGVDGKGYIVKGQPDSNNGVNQNQLWEYEPLTDTWTLQGYVPGAARTFSIGDDMDGKYYFGFGSGRNDLWKFDPDTNEFTELPECPCQPRAHPAFVAHLDKIYMGSGSGNNSDLNDWWVFDFADSTWTQKTNIPGQIRHHPFQFGIDDAIYVGGGHRDNWSRYDINTETWTPINDFPEGRVAGTQFSYNGNGFVLSGDDAQHSTLPDYEFLIYYPSIDEWHELPFESEMHRWAGSSFIIDSLLYYFGGNSAIGNDDQDMWSFNLNTTNCIQPTDFFSVSVEEESAGIFWSSSPTGVVDTLQWRAVGEPDWNTVVNPQSIYPLDNLSSCTEYEYRIKTTCDADNSVYSATNTFLTKGCGTCTDSVYCDVSGLYLGLNTYIEKVKINNFENISGNDGGYSTFTTPNSIEVKQGEFVDIEVQPIFSGALTSGRLKIWIDLDGDANFTDNELLVDANNISDTYTESIQIPLDATPGFTKLRTIFNINNISSACQGSLLLNGEVEDYCMTIIEDDGVGVNELFADRFSIFPNPANDRFTIETTQRASSVEEIVIRDINGVAVLSLDEFKNSIDITELSSGTYFVQIISDENSISKRIIKQ